MRGNDVQCPLDWNQFRGSVSMSRRVSCTSMAEGDNERLGEARWRGGGRGGVWQNKMNNVHSANLFIHRFCCPEASIVKSKGK